MSVAVGLRIRYYYWIYLSENSISDAFKDFLELMEYFLSLGEFECVYFISMLIENTNPGWNNVPNIWNPFVEVYISDTVGVHGSFLTLIFTLEHSRSTQKEQKDL